MSPSSLEGPVSRYLNRPLSRPLAGWLARTPLTPNQVSAFSFLLALGVLGLFAWGAHIAAGVLIQATSVADGVDGDLARIKGMATRFGATFDAIVDRYADAAIVGGMAWWAWQHEDWPQPLLLGLVTLLGFLMVSYSRARLEVVDRGALLSVPSLASRDVRLLLAAIGSVAGQVYWTMAVLAGLSFLLVAWRLAWMWARQRA